MPTIELPALDGRDALGFLAALGLHRLLTREHGDQVQLSFSQTTGRALLHSELPSLDAVIATLTAMVTHAGDNTAIIDIDDRFPFKSATRAQVQAGIADDETDPMRVRREHYPALLEKVTQLGDEAVAWLHVLVTDMAVDGQGRAALTPFCAPAGKQNLRTFFVKPLQAVRKEPFRLTEALTSWRRVDNFTGEYLDHRAIRDAVDHPKGKSVLRGVPGATWLATQALPLFHLTGDGQRTISTLWHSRGNRQIMLWPLWQHPLNAVAAQALLEHPTLRMSPATRPTVKLTSLQNLGVFAVAGAERQELHDSAGVLAPLDIAT